MNPKDFCVQLVRNSIFFDFEQEYEFATRIANLYYRQIFKLESSERFDLVSTFFNAHDYRVRGYRVGKCSNFHFVHTHTHISLDYVVCEWVERQFANPLNFCVCKPLPIHIAFLV